MSDRNSDSGVDYGPLVVLTVLIFVAGMVVGSKLGNSSAICAECKKVILN